MSVPQVTLDQAQLGLAYLLNQNTPPTGEVGRRAFYIASAVQRLYRAFDFDMTEQTVQLSTDDTGLADISDLNLGPLPSILSIDDGTTPFTFVMAKDSINYHQGDHRYWLVLNEDKEWELHTTEPNKDINFRYNDATEISDTNATVVFTQMVIAKGALIYYRQAQDPDADVSVEEDEFRQEVAELTEAQNRRRPQQFASSRRDRYQHYIGRQ